MITEDYVSFEIAKLLKEKGFNEPTFHDYDERGIKWFEEVLVNHNSQGGIACPTLQMVMKWLEEKYGVFCVICRHGNKNDGFTYSWNCEGKIGLSVGNGGGFKTAAEACEAAVKYCLKELI